MKACPHCEANTLGPAQLLALDYFATVECSECQRLISNDGFRQFLMIPAVLGSFAVGLLVFSLVPDLFQPFAILLTFGLVAIVLRFLPQPVKYQTEVSLPSFSPNPDNDKVIKVSGWSEIQLQQMLGDFSGIYNSGWPPFKIDVTKESESYFAITFSQDIHPSLFAFLVNYLSYPIGFERKDRIITVVGHTTLDDSFDGIPPALFGESSTLYPSKEEEEGDLVYLRTETGESFSNLLGDNRWRR